VRSFPKSGRSWRRTAAARAGKEAGTLAPGKVANLLVLDENPLADIRNTRTIDSVVLKGNVIDPGHSSTS